MLKKTWLWMLIAILIAAEWGSGPGALAQDQPVNLLVNSSLEGPYYAQGGATRTVPNGWNLWVGLGAPESLPSSDKTLVRDGAIAWKLKQSGVAFAAAGYQQVSGLAAGDAVRAAAYGWVFTCNDATTSCTISDPPYRRSDAAAGASLKVGIDPTGGIDPLATTVRWSAAVAPYDQWAEISVTAAAQGETVTVFLYMMQATGLVINEVYWDDASLARTTGAESEGGDVPFVVPQGVRPDGSIVHVIQAGDTLWSITYAYLDYGVTVESIAALNNLKPNTRYLQPGQELIILPPGSVDPLTGQPVTPGSVVPPVASATPETAAAPGITASPDVPTALPTLETVPLPGGATAQPTTTVEPTAEPTLTPSPIPTFAPTQLPGETPTPAPSATSTPEAVAAAPEDLTNLNGRLCFTVFQDANLNAQHDEGEGLLNAARLIIVSPLGNTTMNYLGANDPVCTDAGPRQFQIEVQLPTGYGATTPDRVLVRVVAGRRTLVVFGAAPGYTPPPVPEVTPGVQVGEANDFGDVAPWVEVPPTPTRARSTTWVDRLYDNSAFIVLGLGGVIVLASLVLIVIFRRPEV